MTQLELRMTGPGDEATVAAGFDRALRSRGVAAGTRRAGTFAETLRTLPPSSPSALYWRARVAMLPSIDDLDAFHAAFLEFFGTLGDADALRRLVRRVDAPPRREARDLPKRDTVPPPPSERPADPQLAERAPTQWI